MSQKNLQIIIGAVIVIAVVTAVFIQKGWDKPKNLPQGQISKNDTKRKGPQNAPVTIVEYSDFQCPSCAASQQPLRNLLAEFPNEVKVEFRHFPLEMHRFGLKAAVAAECAFMKGRFWEYQDLLFQYQQVWSRDPDPQALFVAIGNSAEIYPAELAECQLDTNMERRVMADKQSGDALKVQSTPTFFINQERVVGSKQLTENGPTIIKRLLQGTSQNKSS